MRNIIFGVVIFMFYQTSFLGAQPQKSILDRLSEDEKETIEALALYPEYIRIAILHVAQYPSLLAKTKRLQDVSKEKFRDLLSEMPQVTQEAFWDLTRYKGLVERLALISRKGQAVDEVLEDYPTIIHERVKVLYQSQVGLFESISQLNAQSMAMENELLQNESTELQASLGLLLDNPDVLSILLEEIELTILVGDLYAQHPDWVLQKADSLHLELVRKNAQEVADWRAVVEKDSKAQDEIYASMSEYQKAYPYDDLYAVNPDWDHYTGLHDDKIVDAIPVFFYYPYSFWYGYPYWYDYPRWRVFPYWYDWGLFPMQHTHSIITGLPRYHVITWYFDRPQHHIRFHHLSTRFIDHYHGHRSLGSGISAGVKSWQQANKDIITDDFLAEGPKLTERIRQFGSMEKARATYNRKHPEKRQTAREFVASRNVKYKELRLISNVKNHPQLPNVATRPISRPDLQKVDTKPVIKTREQIRTIDKAKEYHRNQWTKEAPVKSNEAKSSPRQKAIKPSPREAKRTPVPQKVR